MHAINVDIFDVYCCHDATTEIFNLCFFLCLDSYSGFSSVLYLQLKL